WRYDVLEPGFKYPMSDVQAALGLTQLAKLERFQARRAAVAARYRTALRDLPGIGLPAEAPAGSTHGNHLFVIRVAPQPLGRDRLHEVLRQRGIETSVHFVPLHLHPYFQRAWGYKEGQFPVAERLFSEILSLPMHAAMTEDDAAIVADEIA